jgi:1,4-dihydroxy-2-naphthoate polyprenyltransferase
LSPYQTCIAATLCLSITLLCGIILILSVQQLSNLFLWFLILSSVFNAFAYTAGPYPLGYIGLQNASIAYYGLGDIFVFLYFGLVATYMIPYIIYLRNKNQQQQQQQNEQLDHVSDSWTLLLPNNWLSQVIYGIQIGLLAMNILVVNNLRDRLTDVIANKLTTSVRFGRTFSIIQYITCNVLTYTLVIINTIAIAILLYQKEQYSSSSRKILSAILPSLLPLFSIPVGIKETRSVLNKEGAALNIHVGGAAKVQTLFCLLTAIGIYLSD